MKTVFRFHTEQLREKYDNKALKVMLGCFLFTLIPVALAIFQITKGIFSIFAIVPIIILGIVLVNMFKAKKKSRIEENGLYYDQNIQLSEEEKSAIDNSKKESTYYECIRPLSVKEKLVRWLLGIVLIVVGCAMFYSYFNFIGTHKDYTVVTATVVKQVDKSTYEYETNSDGETEVTEHRMCELTFSYTFKDVKKTVTKYFNGFSEVFTDNFDIFVNKNGDFVATQAEKQSLNPIGIVLIISGVCFLLSIYFSTSNLIFFPFIIFTAGGVLFFAFGSGISFVELLFFDMSVFFSFFACLGLYMYASFFLLPFTLPKDLSEAGEFVTIDPYKVHGKKNISPVKAKHSAFEPGQKVIGRAEDFNNEENLTNENFNETNQGEFNSNEAEGTDINNNDGF